MSRKRRKDYQRQLDSNVEEILAELSRVRMQQLRCIEESYRAALRQALLGALGSFVDIRMIHEQLMGTQVLFLIPAFSYQAEALCEIAKELPKFSSGAVIAAEELPAHEEGQVLCEGKLGIQSVLEMAGFAGAPLRVGGDEA